MSKLETSAPPALSSQSVLFQGVAKQVEPLTGKLLHTFMSQIGPETQARTQEVTRNLKLATRPPEPGHTLPAPISFPCVEETVPDHTAWASLRPHNPSTTPRLTREPKKNPWATVDSCSPGPASPEQGLPSSHFLASNGAPELL